VAGYLQSKGNVLEVNRQFGLGGDLGNPLRPSGSLAQPAIWLLPVARSQVEGHDAPVYNFGDPTNFPQILMGQNARSTSLSAQ
jgi:hypothetical protein